MTGFVRLLGRVGGSLIWLALLCMGLLYIAVGALGVSEITRNYGDQAIFILHEVSALDVAHDERHSEIERKRELLTKVENSLDAAVGELLAKHHPEGGSGSAPGPDAEEEWGRRLDKVAQLRSKQAEMQTDLENSFQALRTNWVNEIPAETNSATGHTLTATEVESVAGITSSLRRLGYGPLFSLPGEILTLVLALSMGALGSALQITKSMLNDDQVRSASYYVVRPFQGMITALVVFVLLKAGQLTISAGGNAGLNNYFVAFVGIVSGVMSLEAYRMIEKAGANFIKSQDEEPRWAFTLKAALAQDGLESDVLADGIGVPRDVMKNWLTEKLPVPAEQQKLIAAWLHRSQRDLFSSLPPDDAAVPPAVEAAALAAPTGLAAPSGAA